MKFFAIIMFVFLLGCEDSKSTSYFSKDSDRKNNSVCNVFMQINDQNRSVVARNDNDFPVVIEVFKQSEFKDSSLEIVHIKPHESSEIFDQRAHLVGSVCYKIYDRTNGCPIGIVRLSGR